MTPTRPGVPGAMRRHAASRCCSSPPAAAATGRKPHAETAAAIERPRAGASSFPTTSPSTPRGRSTSPTGSSTRCCGSTRPRARATSSPEPGRRAPPATAARPSKRPSRSRSASRSPPTGACSLPTSPRTASGRWRPTGRSRPSPAPAAKLDRRRPRSPRACRRRPDRALRRRPDARELRPADRPGDRRGSRRSPATASSGRRAREGRRRRRSVESPHGAAYDDEGNLYFPDARA